MVSKKENLRLLEIRRFYEKEGIRANRYESAAFWERRYHHNKALIVFSLLRQYVKPNQLVLDAGCGSGEFSLVIRDLGGIVVSLDLSKSYLNRLRGFVDYLVCASSDFLPFKSKGFDVVLSADVIEHVVSYNNGLSELNRVYNRILILTTPCLGLNRRIFGLFFPKRLVDLDNKVGHIHILPLGNLSKNLQKSDSALFVKTFHVTQPLPDKYFPKKMSVIVGVFEKIGNTCFPKQGSISLAILRANHHIQAE